MALWRLYYHFVWSTRDRAALITENIEAELYGFMIGKGVALGAIIHAIGGIETHTHLVASVPPVLALADFVKGVKGSSAHHINHGLLRFDRTFRWQGGYGVFSLDSKQLPGVIDYVLNQKEHHRQGTIIPALERDDQDEDSPELWQGGAAIRQWPAVSLVDSERDDQ